MMQQPPSQQNERASTTGSEIASDAQRISATAADRIHSEVDSRKETAVSQAQTVSSAIQRTADGLDESAPAWLKSAFQQGAQQIQRFADTIEQRDSRQLMSEAQDFARNNPGTFLAACAAAGFAAARILKAGAEQQSNQKFSTAEVPESAQVNQPWGDGERGDPAMFQGSTGTSGAGASSRGEFV